MAETTGESLEKIGKSIGTFISAGPEAEAAGFKAQAEALREEQEMRKTQLDINDPTKLYKEIIHKGFTAPTEKERTEYMEQAKKMEPVLKRMKQTLASHSKVIESSKEFEYTGSKDVKIDTNTILSKLKPMPEEPGMLSSLFGMGSDYGEDLDKWSKSQIQAAKEYFSSHPGYKNMNVDLLAEEFLNKIVSDKLTMGDEFEVPKEVKVFHPVGKKGGKGPSIPLPGAPSLGADVGSLKDQLKKKPPAVKAPKGKKQKVGDIITVKGKKYKIEKLGKTQADHMVVPVE